MTDKPDIQNEDPVEVFAGTGWEVALVQSLLENAEINVFVSYGGEGTLAPLDVVGGVPMNRIFVASSDARKAREVIGQFRESMEKTGQAEEENPL